MNESDILSNYINKFSDSNFTSDDVAEVSLSGDFIVSTDTINENIHFFPSDPAKSIAYRLINSNLSDIYAKGSDPIFITLNLSFRPGIEKLWLDEFFGEIMKLKSQHKFKIIGGDTCKFSKNSFSVTIFANKSKNFPKRSNAKVGDDLYITNIIGGSFLGYKSLKSGINSKFLDNYHFPLSTRDFAKLIKTFANSSTDTSDGLYSALENISEASENYYKIDFKKIPFASENFKTEQFCLSDDYQILFSADSSKSKEILEISIKNSLKIAKIGKIVGNFNFIENISDNQLAKLEKFYHDF
jgi:thiamine-monophosphate kinase